MKTIFIYNQGIEAPLSFFVLEGDYRHLDNTYINCTDNEANVEELTSILDYDENGQTKVQLLPTFPVHEVQGETAVIEVGFML